MLTNHQLVNISRREHIPLVGVYSKNQLPDEPDFEGGYIFNLSNDTDENGRSLPGTHWTCSYVEKDKKNKMKTIYYDSFGVGPPISVQNFLMKLTPYPYNNDDIQNINSGWCGLYCLYTIWFLSEHKHKIPNLEDRYKLLLKQFKDDPEKNLTLLKKYVKELKK